MKLLIGKINKIFILSFIFFGATAVKSDKLPIFVPLSQTDLDDPQVGYMHASIGMEGGTYFFGKKGDPIERIKKLELERFTFLKNAKRKLLKDLYQIMRFVFLIIIGSVLFLVLGKMHV